MTSEVLALVKDTVGVGVSVRNVPLRELRPHEVLVRPAVGGLCGADVKTFRWHPDRQRFLNQSMPVILGHEVAGNVVEVGEAVSTLVPGQRVLTDPLVSCGTCRLCLAGRPQICVDRVQLGYQVDGGLAELAVLPSRTLVPLPPDIPWGVAPVLEVLAIAVHALERAGLVTGQDCAVVGAGPLGLMLVRALRAVGAGTVVVVGTARSPRRLEAALASGADQAVTDTEVASLSDRFETVFEVGGTPEALMCAALLVRRGGRIIYASGFDAVAPLRLNTDFKNREVDLLTSTGHPPSAWERAIGLAASHRVSLEGLIDMTVPLAEAADGLAAMSSRQVTKCLVVVDETSMGSV